MPVVTKTKSIELENSASGEVLEVHLSGKLEKADYETFSPIVEGMIKEHGKVRMLVILDDFHGWKMGALWEDIKFDVKHFNDVERLALVGETKWEKGMATFCRPFTTAKVKFFPHDQLADARQWVEGS